MLLYVVIGYYTQVLYAIIYFYTQDRYAIIQGIDILQYSCSVWNKFIFCRLL